MQIECGRHQCGFHVRPNASQPNEKDSGVQQSLPENEIAKVFVGRQQYPLAFEAKREHGVIVDARFGFGHVQNLVTVQTKPVYDVFVDILVRDDLHA